MLETFRPATPGFAVLHHGLLLAYLEEAQSSTQNELIEYRKLALTHCLKGIRSKKKTADAERIILSLKTLFKGMLAEWRIQPMSTDATLSNRGVEDIISDELTKANQAITQLFELKS